MASVKSLGLHRPTGYQHLDDGLAPPSKTSHPDFAWDVKIDDQHAQETEDELVVTKTCVIWSRGGVFRKSFRFDQEKEPIVQALITYFPTSEDQVKDAQNTSRNGSEGREASPKLAKAIIVFLKTQAHVYFLAGTTHIVHLPFEVESVCAAPQGVVIQRKQHTDSIAPVSLKFPKVPPNSFVSSQITAPSLRESTHSTFSVEGLGKPKALPMRLTSTLEHMWDQPLESSQSSWPRLVSLLDPLQEVGLVVTTPGSPRKGNRGRNLSRSPYFLEPSEEILHIESIELPMALQTPGNKSLILAVTVNKDNSNYNIWRLTYIKNGDPFTGTKNKTKTETKADRRRSSMQPGFADAASTPIQSSFRESFGAPLPGKRPRRSERLEKAEKAEKTDKPLDLVSSLDPEKDSGANRRSSRRVSSMLARADLSATHERASFTDHPQASGHNASRRMESFGSQSGRLSGGYGSFNYNQTIHPSLGSLLEAPVDNVLDELRSGGDFEGFHNMGLDDREFDGLTQEIKLTKILSSPMENSNLRYSASSQPSKTQSKVFILTAPRYYVEDRQKTQAVICIQDSAEKRVELLIVDIEKGKQHLAPPSTGHGNSPDLDDLNYSWNSPLRAHPVVDSCKITDGPLSAILILSEGTDGSRELSIQAPWLGKAPITLPRMLLENERSLQHAGRVVDRDVRQRRSEGPEIASSSIRKLCNSMAGGLVDMIDGENRHHQIQIQLRPRNPLVSKVLDACRSVISPSHSRKMLPGWWHAMLWLRTESAEVADLEWSALIIHVFALCISLSQSTEPPTTPRRSRRSIRHTHSSSLGSIRDTPDWSTLQLHEAPNALEVAPWQLSEAWDWTLVDDEGGQRDDGHVPSPAESKFLTSHIRHARSYLSSNLSTDGSPRALADSILRNVEDRVKTLWDLFVSLHLLLEEQKLDIMVPESSSPGSAELRAVMAQIARWLGWHDFAHIYDLGVQEAVDLKQNTDIAIEAPPPQPSGVSCDVIEWIRSCLTTGTSQSFLSVSQSDASFTGAMGPGQLGDSDWNHITPRTLMFARFFNKLTSRSDAVGIVEAMYDAGITRAVLETLPEAVLAPLRDAISRCQSRPPTTWSKDLLNLIDRGDISQILEPGKTVQSGAGLVMAPSHNASWDFHTICQTIEETNNTSYDDEDGTQRQAIIRALFKEDRRLREAQDLLSTHKARIVRLQHDPEWSDSEYLEKQKDLVSRLATGTLAIPAGRALLYYSSSFPLLTQKVHIGGFNLNCIVRPANVHVGVDKALYTEEKVCWGFFHQGVAAGLAISPQAKGIDTSWILYNKPGQDLSNRHAGFLLALGLNGHLKDVAKWVAFKYLTPKHTMTSIGLLLGLAASYLGTMDSLITRLLSVHVTRMLPRGAAELNLSPLTQTTGIMGIGLLYCESQHRRMSEIMMSEIAHVDEEDEEDPLRSEGYRLAAGFSLGFINLGKGKDLKGLHDMKLTEKLITIATATKKVEMVHVIDRATAGAVMAIALIFMKSEDHIVARKIDVPDSVVQFDYVRPDVLLLRTVAKNLILWSRVEPTFEWVFNNLPVPYRFRHKLSGTITLQSTDLPFFSILAGLCFSLALRFAGSGSVKARDLLVHYLDQFMRVARIAPTKRAPPFDQPIYDEELARSNARMCQDVLALSAGIVMAGTGDLVVLRRLRSLHGREDSDTPYGSHLAAHLAIGALFLGCGTATFGTSNLAIGSLLVAFYPIFPVSVVDNRSHLQAFRHFWVLATDPRCLVVKDVATGQPISVPIHIRMKQPSWHSSPAAPADSGREDDNDVIRTTPCLLPPLSDIASLHTNAGPAFWDVELDFDASPSLAQALSKNQSIFLRRRPPQEDPFAATLRALGRDALADVTHEGSTKRDPLEWVFGTESLGDLTRAEQRQVLDHTSEAANESGGGGSGSAVDARLVLEQSVEGSSRERLQGLKLLFEWADVRDKMGEGNTFDEDRVEGVKTRAGGEAGEGWWIRDSVVEALKGRVFLAGQEDQEDTSMEAS